MQLGKKVGIILTEHNLLEEWEQIPLLSFDKEEELASIEERVENLLKEKVNELGYELYDVEYAKERKKLLFKNIYRQRHRN